MSSTVLNHANAFFPNLGGTKFFPARLRRRQVAAAVAVPPSRLNPAKATARLSPLPAHYPPQPAYHRPPCCLDGIAPNSAADPACCRRQEDDCSRARVPGPENHQGVNACSVPQEDHKGGMASSCSPRFIACVSWAHQIDLCDREVGSFATRLQHTPGTAVVVDPGSPHAQDHSAIDCCWERKRHLCAREYGVALLHHEVCLKPRVRLSSRCVH